MDPQVDRALAAARARGIDIRDKLGGGSYCEAWAVGDALVMRIPRALPLPAERPDPLPTGFGPLLGDHVSPTGPYVIDAVMDPATALALFEASIDRVRDARGPLARFVDRIELDTVPVALHERAAGTALSTSALDAIRPLLPRIARTLLELHDTFGFHGDVKPTHVFVGDAITFIDPLPIFTGCVGSAGYSLPTLVVDPNAPRDEGRLLGDVASLAAITAECCGVDLGFGDLLYLITNLGNGRFGRGFDPRAVIADRRGRAASIADPTLRAFVDRAITLAFAAFDPWPTVPAPGLADALLADFAQMA